MGTLAAEVKRTRDSKPADAEQKITPPCRAPDCAGISRRTRHSRLCIRCRRDTRNPCPRLGDDGLPLNMVLDLVVEKCPFPCVAGRTLRILNVEHEENPAMLMDSAFHQVRNRLEIGRIGLSAKPEDDLAILWVRKIGVHCLMRVKRGDTGRPSQKDRAFFRLWEKEFRSEILSREARGDIPSATGRRTF